MRLPQIGAGTLALLLTLLMGIAQATDYNIDTAHSTVGFKIKHLGVSWVRGTFKDFKGTIMFDAAKPEDTKVEVTIQTASIDTDNEARDEHLRKPDFFDAKKYPTITFKSKKVKDFDGNTMTLLGDLTMHGVTKEVALEVTDLGKDVHIEEFKTTKRAASAKTKINRLDFGISTSQMLGMGEMTLGDEVFIEIDLELDKVEPKA